MCKKKVIVPWSLVAKAISQGLNECKPACLMIFHSYIIFSLRVFPNFPNFLGLENEKTYLCLDCQAVFFKFRPKISHYMKMLVTFQ